GLKTGHTREAGYGLVGSVQRNGRRVIFAITGLNSDAARADEAERLVNWAFRQFKTTSLGAPGHVIAVADVWMGRRSTVGLTLEGEPQILLPRTGQDQMTSHVEYISPLAAPIKGGDVVAELVIKAPSLPETRLPLIAAEDVPVGGFLSRVMTAGKVLLAQMGDAL
ncbi:MAG: D-alanyl-D-alanine carboxypeptidase, partial [Pseudomonadota bacterium]